MDSWKSEQFCAQETAVSRLQSAGDVSKTQCVLEPGDRSPGTHPTDTHTESPWVEMEVGWQGQSTPSALFVALRQVDGRDAMEDP